MTRTLTPESAPVAFVSYVLRNARPKDRLELEACVDLDVFMRGISQFWASAAFKAGFFDAAGLPCAFITFHRTTPVTLSVSLIATDNWRQVVKPLLRWGLKFFKTQAIEIGYRRVECRTITGNDDAIRMLEGLGFVFETEIRDYGLGGGVFEQYAWRLSDHVHLFRPKNA